MDNIRDKENIIKTVIAFLILGLMFFVSARIFLSPRDLFPIYPSKGLTRIDKLSDYFPRIKNSNGDSDIYVFDSGQAGGTFLILGGTHNDEPSGHMSAVLMTENIEVKKGRVIVIPHANRSGLTNTTPLEGYPREYKIETPEGVRWFNFGSRYTNPTDQWPDPELYVHYPSGQKLAGSEARNLNRSWPGRPNGNFTEQIAYALSTLIRNENVDVVIDYHEAPLEYFLINAICFHEKSSDIATTAYLNLSLEDLQFNLEASPPGLQGFSHREIGDNTQAMPILMETANPQMGRFRGKSTSELITLGTDSNYVKAAQYGRLYVPMDEEGWPLSLRVARHVKATEEIINAFNELYPEKEVIVENIPPYDGMVKGIGNYLNTSSK